jgi:hypothetical protein
LGHLLYIIAFARYRIVLPVWSIVMVYLFGLMIAAAAIWIFREVFLSSPFFDDSDFGNFVMAFLDGHSPEERDSLGGVCVSDVPHDHGHVRHQRGRIHILHTRMQHLSFFPFSLSVFLLFLMLRFLSPACLLFTPSCFLDAACGERSRIGWGVVLSV